ncbi:sigma factor-like helix-turn-helix DNA-binding protein [Frankia sp. AvcI1]|uniref:helix-turn-helix transcriptional regulator n=1 Tax=Frankia sp. AvcI1 TaxID=573496 RepID=UPI002118D138|nr:sigma factor-like helix-turn-helix DNA-binding protein [Frankia sp. AvcI1]
MADEDEGLMTTGDIAERMGITRERVRQLSHRADWPAPARVIGELRAWRRDDVEEWISTHRPGLAGGPAAG